MDIHEAYENGIHDINDIADKIFKDFEKKGGAIAHAVAKQMARDHYLIGSAFLSNGNKEAAKERKKKLVEAKKLKDSKEKGKSNGNNDKRTGNASATI